MREPFESVVTMIATRANGGPYDDDSFLAGFMVGDIGATLSGSGVEMMVRTVPVELVDQIDLVAMWYGFSLYVEHQPQNPGWAVITLMPEERLP